MNILSVYAHHEPRSLTTALKNVAVSTLAKQGHTVVESDLYASGFSPKAEKYDFVNTTGKHFNYLLEQQNTAETGMGFAPDIVGELDKLAAADMVLFHFPLWWHAPPAVLKGWFDRVLAMGVAWAPGKTYETGMLRGKRAMLCVSVGYPKEFYSAHGKHKANLMQMLHPVQYGTLAACGFDVLEPFVVYDTMGLSKEKAEKVIADYEFRMNSLVDSPSYLFSW